MNDFNETSIDYKKNSSLFGLIYGLFSAVLLYLNFKLSLDNTVIMSFVSLAVAVVIVFYPIHVFKLNNNNLLSIGQALKIGLIVGLIGGLIYAFYTYLHYNSIDTEFVSKALEESDKALQESSNEFTDEQMAQAKEMASVMVSPFTFATINLFTLLFKSFIIALVVGLIKKN